MVAAPVFYPLGISLIPQLIETSAGHKGGALSYERIKRHLLRELRRDSQPIVTTLIDLYQLDRRFPGHAKAAGKPLSEMLGILKTEFHKDIVDFTGCRPDHFIPFIQPYEFEALLFSDVPALTSIADEWKTATPALQAIRDSVDSPEHINDHPSTKPAALLGKYLANPRYRKVLHGSRAAQAITLSKIEAECHFFHGWIERLRGLSLH